MNAIHRSPLKLGKKNLWVKTMLKNRPVINVRPVSVGIYDLLTSQVASFPHLPQLLAPGCLLASPLQLLACKWRCLTMNQTTVLATRLADMAPAVHIHGPAYSWARVVTVIEEPVSTVMGLYPIHLDLGTTIMSFHETISWDRHTPVHGDVE